MDFDYQYLVVVLLRLFTLSLIVQLALDSLYRWEGFLTLDRVVKFSWGAGLKWPVSVALSVALCMQTDFDCIAELFATEQGWAGYLVTALAVTGGTAPFIAAFAKIEAARTASKTIILEAKARQNGGAT